MLYTDKNSPCSSLKGAALSIVAALLLAACGGGGGSGGTASTPGGASASGGSTTAPVSVAETILASELSADICAAPRVGIDPSTGRPYLDKQGTYVDEKKWLRAWMDETYLWYNEIPSTIRIADFGTPQLLFEALRTPATTASGKRRDQFHFTYDTATWQALTTSGIEAGYGFETAILKSSPPRDVRVAYTEPNTPAAAAGITRGARILFVDGVDVVTSNNIAGLNAALFPSSAGQEHSFRIQELDGTVRTLTLTSAQITKTPVQNVKTLTTATGKVGYFLFNDHIATSEQMLINAVNQLKAEGVQDLVLDIRYNGGGTLAIASELAFMIAGSAATNGKVFEKLVFNNKNPFGLTEAQASTPFQTTSLGLSGPAGQALPQLGLSRVTVLTGPGTCSASESIINGLRGVGVTVNVIGDTTCGKPYGFLPTDNCGTTYFAIQFKGVNDKGEGDYADGIAATCQVADDFNRQLGDPAEGRLAAALNYRTTGQCPAVVTSATLKSSLLDGVALSSGKSPARTGRFLAPGAVTPR